jgi:hypothetical protein
VVYWAGLIVVFLLALLPRLTYSLPKPVNWYNRSVRFWDALLAGDWAGTYQQYHPGVTTMWVAGFGLRLYMATHGLSSDDMLNPELIPPDLRGQPHEAGVAALGLVITACIGLCYVLLARLTNWPVAFSGGCLLALDPFYIAQSKIVHVDALLASFMLISVLFVISYLQQKRWPYLIFSGMFAGLAFLTKSSSGCLIPYVVLIMIAYWAPKRWRTPAGLSGMRIHGRYFWNVCRDLGVWGLVAACVFALLWPAVWVIPGQVFSGVVQRALFHVETPHYNPTFFAGRVIYGDPGPLFYLAVIGWETTVVTLPALLATALFLLRRARSGEYDGPVWWLLVYACAFTVAMMLAARKELRYLLPIFPALDVLAAWGLAQIASVLGQWGQRRKRIWVPMAIVMTALVAQAGAVFSHNPYYSTHHNLLLGGSRAARYILPLGDQGEGVDLAVRFLNGYPRAEQITVGLQERGDLVFRRSFVGSAQPIESPNVDYWVFLVNPIQREIGVEQWGKTWEACQRTEPLWTVSFDGVPYVWIYRAYPYDPQAFAIGHRLNMQLGEHIRLLGYQLSANDLSAGTPLTVTLFWQSDGRLTEDYHVFVHLLNVEGQMMAQRDGVPGQDKRPTWSWRDMEILRDEYMLDTDGLSDGTYVLSVGMYDFSTGSRIPAVSPVAGRLPEDRVVLDDIRVTLP